MSYQEKFDQNQDSDFDIEEGEAQDMDDDSYDGKECGVCKDIPESIIYLSCDHIICLVCAAKSILSNDNSDDIDFSKIVCLICGESTLLSKEVQETLCEFLTQENLLMNSDEENESSNDEIKTEEREDEISEDENSIKKTNDRQQLIRKVETEKGEEPQDSQREINNQKMEESQIKNSQNDQNNSEESDSEKSDDLSFVFACQTHFTEDYQYYNPENKKLYCAQCLLDQNEGISIPNVKPLKRCFPEILQNVQDMINDVEVSKNLMENKKKDFEIRKDNCKAQIYSYYKKFEIQINEVSQQINDQKNNFLQEFERKGEQLLDEIQTHENQFDEKIGYFSSIVSQINQFKNESENPEEEILSFFFANQDKIYESLQEQNKNDFERNFDNQIFNEFQKKLEREQQFMILKNLETLQEKIGQKISSLQRSLKVNDKKNNEENHPMNFAKYERDTQSKTLQNQSNYNNFFERMNTYNRQQQSISVEPKKNKSNYYEAKKKINIWDGDSSKLSKDFNNSYFNTLNKSQYKIEDRNDKKFKFFDLKYKKDNIYGSINTMINFKKSGKPYSNHLYSNKFQLLKFEKQNNVKSSNFRSFNNKSLMSIK